MKVRLAAGVLLYALLLVACGANDAGHDGGRDRAKVIDPASMEHAKGQVTVCMGKDAGEVTEAVKQFNTQQNGVTVRLLELAPAVDELRARFVQRLEAKSEECDVFSSDVIWTAEFASQTWLYDMTPYVESRKDELIPATLGTANYEGNYWGVPQQTDAALLYYRTDQVKDQPQTWQEVYDIAGRNDGIVYQGAPYEGLTCDFLEIAFAAGGEVLSEDGKTAVVDSPENLAALEFMVDGVENGVAVNGVTTYMEEESRRFFENGRATFMRNWPYAYALGQKQGSKIQGKFDVMPFPEFEGAGRAGILGGWNQVVSVYSKNPGGALKWIDYVTGEENQKRQFLDYSAAPIIAAVYDDPEVQKKYKFATQLRVAVSQAKARPMSPVYPQISQAIYKNVNEALSGRTSPEDALKRAQSEMQAALETF